MRAPAVPSRAARPAPGRGSSGARSPTRRAPRSRRSSSSAPSASSAVNGSSSTSSSGSCSSARQSASRCTIPREYEATRSARTSQSPKRSSSIPAPLAALRHAVETPVEVEVLERGQVAVEQRLVAEVAEPAAVGGDVELAARRRREARDEPEQRRLARPVRARDDEEAAALELEVERPQRARRLPVALLERPDARRSISERRRAGRSREKTMLITPLTVKNAASRRRRSPGRTSECSYASSAATATTPSQYDDADVEPEPRGGEQRDRAEMVQAGAEEDAALAEAHRPRVQSLLPVVLDVEERVEEVEARHPERDRAAERPRLPRQLAGHRHPRADRREPERDAEPRVAEPGDPLQVRVDDEQHHRHRPEPAHERVELEDGDEEDARARARTAPITCARESAPAGSSREAVRGFRASSSASISRFRPIASVRAPTIATVTQSQSRAGGSLADGEQHPDVRERQREDRVLELHERGEAARQGDGGGAHVCLCAVSAPASSPSAWASAGRSTANPSRQPPGEPGG